MAKHYYLFENGDPKDGSRVVYRSTREFIIQQRNAEGMRPVRSNTSSMDYTVSQYTGPLVAVGMAEAPMGLYLGDRLVDILESASFGPNVITSIEFEMKNPIQITIHR